MPMDHLAASGARKCASDSPSVDRSSLSPLEIRLNGEMASNEIVRSHYMKRAAHESCTNDLSTLKKVQQRFTSEAGQSCPEAHERGLWLLSLEPN